MPTIARYDTVWTGVAGAPYYSAMYAEADNGSSEVVEAIIEFWNDLGAYIANDVTWTVSGTVTLLDDATGVVTGTQSVDGDTSGAGVGTGDMLPPATQGLLQLRTGQYTSGRELRGRLFIPCVVEDAASNGVPSTAFRTALIDAAEVLGGIGGGVVGGFNGTWCVWSRTHGVTAPVATFTTPAEFAVLRSRRD